MANGDGVAANPTLSLPATIDLGGKTSLEIPNSAAPTVDADGEVAVDTTVTDFSHGIVKYFGGEELGVVAMPIAQFTSPTDGHLVTYDAAADEFKLAAPAGSGSGIVLLTSGTVAVAATLDLVLTAYTGYRALKFVLESFIPATDDVELWMRVSTNGGSSYDTSGYSYTQVFSIDSDNGAFGNSRSGSAGQWLVAGSPSANQAVSNVAAEAGASAEVILFDQTVSQWPKIRSQAIWFGAATTDSMQMSGGGHRETSQDTDAVRFLFEGGGNITSGKYAVYGLL